jgi:hypothetical protein
VYGGADVGLLLLFSVFRYTTYMNWIDRLPSKEKKKLRKRMRSPEEYERLRERVKGPEDLEKEMVQNELLAELKFTLETEPHIQEELRKDIEKDMSEQGIENIAETSALSPEARKALKEGKFAVAMETNTSTGHEQIVLQPEGNVSEKVALQQSVSDQYTDGFISAMGGGVS